MTKLTGLLCCATLALAAIPAWAQTAAPAGAILTPQSSAGRTPTPVATAPAPAASAPGALTPTPTTPVATAIPHSRDDGAFAALPPGEQRVARALYGGQRPGGWSLDRVAAAHHHEGWGRVFNQMRAEGLVHGRNLGQLMREEDGREWLARHDDMGWCPVLDSWERGRKWVGAVCFCGVEGRRGASEAFGRKWPNLDARRSILDWMPPETGRSIQT